MILHNRSYLKAIFLRTVLRFHCLLFDVCFKSVYELCRERVNIAREHFVILLRNEPPPPTRLRRSFLFIQGNNRNSQNSKLLFDLLTNSISIDGLQCVQLWRNQYELNGLVSGECLLKVIIRESYLDSNATVSTLRLNLTNLDEYVLSNGTDIVAFNAYVQSQVDGLTARSEITNDLIVNLFKGYRAMKDQVFLDYL